MDLVIWIVLGGSDQMLRIIIDHLKERCSTFSPKGGWCRLLIHVYKRFLLLGHICK